MRIYIEKKENLEGKNLLKEFENFLQIKNIKSVRVINAYDFVGVEQVDGIVNALFGDKNIYKVEKNLNINENEKCFRIKFLDGQYNQREDSINKIVNKFMLSEDIEIYNSQIIVIENISDKDLDVVKKYVINPIEMIEVDLDKVYKKSYEENFEKVEVLTGFKDSVDEKLQDYKNKYSIGIDLDDLKLCRDYFKKIDKDPTITEIKLIDTYWSDHCRHTTFNTEITEVKLEDGEYKEVFEKVLENYINSREYAFKDDKKHRPITLMDLATINMREQVKSNVLDNKEVSDEVNAASIEIDVDVDGKIERWLLMFKNETHNHPTEMEPFGGAATCLGGAIRDPLSGRAYVYQAMRITGSKDPRQKFEDTLEGKLPQRFITRKAMQGYSSYGNEIGAATGYVKEYYDDGFVAKRLECGALVAAAKKENVYRGKAEPGDVVILVGGKTGKDGLGGAVGSSKKHTEDSLEQGGAEVQKGNPQIERKIIRLFRKKEVSKMIKICNDFGAGGVGVAIGELADGIDIDLNKVPVKYSGLNGTEIALSESQERMAVVVDRKDLERFLEEAEKEDVQATKVATVTEEKILKMTWNDDVIVNIDRSFLDTNGSKKYTKVKILNPENRVKKAINEENNKEKIKKYLSDLNICSQKALVENFDNTVGGENVLMPYGGKYRLSESEGMVAKIPVLEGHTNTCSIMTHGYDPKICKWSPFHGGYYAVIESIARVAALGGDVSKVRLSFQEYFERIDNIEEKWGKPMAALLGAYEVQRVFDIAAIGGKDSMSGTFEDINVPPTLISFAVTSENIKNIISKELKSKSSKLILIESKKLDKELLDLEDLKKKYKKVKELVDNSLVLSANSVKNGGIITSILEMAFGNKIGVEILENNLDLYKEDYGSLVLEVEDLDKVKNILGEDFILIGQTNNNKTLKIEDEEIDLDELINSYKEPLEEVFHIAKGEEVSKEILYKDGLKIENKVKVDKPKVLIPVFPGTHGEYTLEQAFKKVGAEVETYVFKTQNKELIEESYNILKDKINNCNILALADGAIYGDEPEGGGKLLSLILTNELIKEAIDKHLNEDDGLILGVGNGFEGLLKAGLIEGDFSLVENKDFKFISEIVDVKVTSNLTPFVREMEVGDVYSSVLATREGRIVVANKEDLNKGQVITQFEGENLTASEYGIESLSSIDGRVYGTITSIDRIKEDLYKNIDIKGSLRIFESAVSYFK